MKARRPRGDRHARSLRVLWSCPCAGALVVRLEGELDIASADVLARACRGLDPTGLRTAVFDLRRLRFMDCRGLRALMAAHARLAVAGAQVGISLAPGGPVARLIDLVGVAGRLGARATEPAELLEDRLPAA